MADCVSKVELSVSCTDLLDKDVGSKSDPLCVLLQSSGGGNWTEVRWQERSGIHKPLLYFICNFMWDKLHISPSLSVCQLGRTERLKNTSSPSFSQRLRLDYHFETVQNLKLGVYDIDNSTSDLSDDDYLGGVELTLGQVHTKPAFDHYVQVATRDSFHYKLISWSFSEIINQLFFSLWNGRK